MQRLPSHYIIGHIGPSGSLKYESITVLVCDEASRDQLIELAESLHAGQHRADHIKFVDYIALAAVRPSLGEWSPGDVSGLRDKDWSRRPSQEDVHLWEDHQQEEAPLRELDEDTSIRRVAGRREVSEYRVKEALH
jgi:broad specificity phosphatase PhoE